MPKNRRRNQKQNSAAPAMEKTVADPMVVHSNGESLAVETAPAFVSGVVTETPALAAAPTLRSLANVLTLEFVLYVFVFVCALLLRVMNLDARPLAPAEAQTAAAAWEFLNGGAASAYTSPLLFTLNWLAFFLFGAFDLTARFVPAVLSALLVFIPLGARNALGKTGAFVAALLFAFSPTTLFFAREVSGAELGVGAALGALILFWRARASNSTRPLYAGAVLAALALTADAAAFTLLLAGGMYFAFVWARARGAQSESQESAELSLASALQIPLVRALIFFAVTYIISATTFLLNRDGLGIAFNLLGEWFGAFSTIGDFVSPLNGLVVYEPLVLIFGIAALVLVVTLRGGQANEIGLLRILALVAVLAFLLYSLAGNKNPSVIVAITLPLALLAGWFIGNLLERARDDIEMTGGWNTIVAGEIPVFVMLLVLAALIYLQIATFLQQTRFSPALDALYQVLSVSSAEMSLVAAAITLAIISVMLLGVFIGLSILLVGVARTTTLLAFAVLVILALGMVRATWLLNFSNAEPVRELVAPSQTPLQIRDLVRDMEFYSQARYGDAHVVQVAASPELGAVGRWYLRVFPNIVWSNQADVLENAQVILTPSQTPPPGDWMGQAYRIGTEWEPTNLDGLALWKWYIFRQGGDESAQKIMLWMPTESE